MFSRLALSVLYWVFKTNPQVSMAYHTQCFLVTLSAALLSLLKSVETVFNLSTSVLSTTAFNVTKSDFAAKLDVSTPVALFKSAFVA